jgi:hypothetical protein
MVWTYRKRDVYVFLEDREGNGRWNRLRIVSIGRLWY